MFTAEAPLIKQEQQYTDEIDIQWALDLLKPDPNYKLSFMQTYVAEGLFVGSGFAIGCLKNYVNKRPFLAGKCIYQYAILLIAVNWYFSMYILQHNFIIRLYNIAISCKQFSFFYILCLKITRYSL